MRKWRIMARITLSLLVSLVLLRSPYPVAVTTAGETTTAVAIAPVVGPPGTVIQYLGVGFSPGGRVSVWLVHGLGATRDEPTAGPTGMVSGYLRTPDVPAGGRWEGERLQVFAVDEATGRMTQFVHFQLTSGPALDYPLPNGRFFTQGNGFPRGLDPRGFQVVDSSPFVVQVLLFTEFESLGGVEANGYPISRPFVREGFVTQVFQKGVLQWRPELKRATFADLMDELHEAGFDDYLFVVRSTPHHLDLSAEEAGFTYTQTVQHRLSFLDANPPMRGFFLSYEDALLRFGLPTSRVEDMGSHFAIRTQRAVLQQWKEDVPWARAGEVVLANAGELAKEVGLFPHWVSVADGPPSLNEGIVAYSPRPWETVSQRVVLRGDAQAFEGTVVFDLVDESGSTLAHGFTTARTGGPEFGRFLAQLEFRAAREQQGILCIYEISPRDGTIMARSLVLIPLNLRP